MSMWAFIFIHNKFENVANYMYHIQNRWKNATSIIIGSNFLKFPASVLQLNSKNIDNLMQKLCENETRNTVSKLKLLSLFVLCCTSENGYVMASYNFKWQWQGGSICGLSLQNGILVLHPKCSSVCIAVALLCTDTKIISLLIFLHEESQEKNTRKGETC